MNKRRLQKLEELVARRARGRCPGTPAIFLPQNHRDPLPPTPPPCRRCGNLHGVVIYASPDAETSQQP
jgi:hypothetical protein